MSDRVQVAASADNATLLLEQAEKKDVDVSEVRVDSGHSTGLVFDVPADLAKAAGVDVLDNEDEALAEEVKAAEKEPQIVTPPSQQEQEPAKKTAAKKTAKRSPAKKTAKKTAAKKS
jgi:hypothetical protein